MTKKYYKYGQVKSHLDELQEKTNECTALILMLNKSPLDAWVRRAIIV